MSPLYGRAVDHCGKGLEENEYRFPCSTVFFPAGRDLAGPIMDPCYFFSLVLRRRLQQGGQADDSHSDPQPVAGALCPHPKRAILLAHEPQEERRIAAGVITADRICLSGNVGRVNMISRCDTFNSITYYREHLNCYYALVIAYIFLRTHVGKISLLKKLNLYWCNIKSFYLWNAFDVKHSNIFSSHPTQPKSAQLVVIMSTSWLAFDTHWLSFHFSYVLICLYLTNRHKKY